MLPNLDGIRAIACLLVLLAHMPSIGKGEMLGATGVGTFFALSGFLMGYLYGRTPWSFRSVARYSVLRFSRIAPIYWLVVSVCIVLSYYASGQDFPLHISGDIQIARHYLFVGSSGVFWSISPEVQYYGFFLLVWWAVALSSRRSIALPFLALVCSALLLTHNFWPGLALPHKLHFFIAGSIAGLAPRASWEKATDSSVLPWLQLGALLLLVTPIGVFASKEDFYAESGMGVTCAVSIYLLSFPSRWTTLVFASPWIRRIGQASFSIYLMHVLVFYYGMQALGLTQAQFDPLWLLLGFAGVAIPMLASRYIEMPLQKVTRRALERGFGLTEKPAPQSAIVI